MNELELPTLYAKGFEQGYTTYPFSPEFLQQQQSKQ